MMGAYLADLVVAELADSGEEMTLTRPGGASVSVKAKRFGSSAETVVNGQTRTTFSVKLSNAEIAAMAWPGPPRKKDTVAVGGRTYVVEESDPRLHDGIVLCHILRVTG